MEKASRSARTHSRKELAAPRAPIFLGLAVAGSAVMLFAILSHLLN
jgi:hypothetical protein